MIKIEASGDGYLIRGKEISQKTYEYFKDDSDLLEQHVTQYEDDSVPEEISIGIHDDCATWIENNRNIIPDSANRNNTTYEVQNNFIENTDDIYKDFPDVSKFLQDIYDICRKGNYIESEDGDYGSIPSFYCSINIGDWDNSYVLIQK